MSSIVRHSILYAQNFLKSSCLVDSLLDRYGIGPDDILYEMGPGKGTITECLARGINCSPKSLTNLDTVFSPP